MAVFQFDALGSLFLNRLDWITPVESKIVHIGSRFKIKYILLRKAGALNHITIELTTCCHQLPEHEILGYVLIFSNAQN